MFHKLFSVISKLGSCGRRNTRRIGRGRLTSSPSFKSRKFTILGLLATLLLMELSHVQGLVNVPRDGPDLSAQLLLNSVEGESVVVGDQIDCNTKVAEPSTSPDSMEVGFSHLGEVEVDHHVDCLNVDTTSEQVGTDQVSTQTSSEVMENSVPVSLSHLGVDVVTGVAQLGYLLSQQFHTLGRVAEDDTLVNLQLGEKCVEAVNLLTFLDEGVVLSNAL